jgi:hypothetical protein
MNGRIAGIVGGSTIAAVAIGVLIAVAATTGSGHAPVATTPVATTQGTSSTSPTASPTDGPRTDDPAPITEADATTAVSTYLSTTSTAEETDLADVAAGAMLDELAAEREELETNGWTISGRAKVDSVEVVKASDKHGTATVLACIDSSAVTILDADGAPLGASQTPRALNLFTLIDDGGTWKIQSRTFPEDPAC